jgi:asparagine synthetase B (glutamine-hydrolysing)
MCGIGILFHFLHSKDDRSGYTCSSTEFEDRKNAMIECLGRRGPTKSHQTTLNISETASLVLCGAVLHIQGNECVSQPVFDRYGNSLLWNGEVFGGLDYPEELCDTTALLNLFSDELCEFHNPIRSPSGYSALTVIMNCLIRVRGPYSFIYYHAQSRRIFFGRDPFGRRSLLLNKTLHNDTVNVIASVSFPLSEEMSQATEWEEIAIGGVYSLPLNADLTEMIFEPWPETQLKLFRELIPVNIPSSSSEFTVAVAQFSEILQNVLKKRLSKMIDLDHNTIHKETHSHMKEKPSRIGVLFSGGIDSLLLAVILHLTMVDHDEPIDLLNVAFLDNKNCLTSAPDRLSGIIAYLELKVSIAVTHIVPP